MWCHALPQPPLYNYIFATWQVFMDVFLYTKQSVTATLSIFNSQFSIKITNLPTPKKVII